MDRFLSKKGAYKMSSPKHVQKYPGGNTEEEITSRYVIDDGLKLKIPYSFAG